MRMGKVLFFGFCSVLLYSQAFSDPRIEVDARYWFTDLSASAKVTTDSLEGTKVDFKNDLGISDDDFFDYRIVWKVSENNAIRLGYTEIDYSSSGPITRSVVFDGKTYTAGTTVNSQLDLQYFRLGWISQFLNLKDGMIQAGPLVDIKVFSVEASLDAPSLAISEAEEFVGGIPTLGVALKLEPHPQVDVFTEISGMSAGSYGYLYDAEIGVKYVPLENFSVVGGYRVLEIKGEDDSDYAKVEIDGPFLGAILRF